MCSTNITFSLANLFVVSDRYTVLGLSFNTVLFSFLQNKKIISVFIQITCMYELGIVTVMEEI